MGIVLTFFISLNFCLSVCLTDWLTDWLTVSLSASLSVCLSVCLTACLSVYLSACLSICLSACLPACLSVCLSVCFLFCSVFTNLLVRRRKNVKRHWRKALFLMLCFLPIYVHSYILVLSQNRCWRLVNEFDCSERKMVHRLVLAHSYRTRS